jgi:hypothetical protein
MRQYANVPMVAQEKKSVTQEIVNGCAGNLQRLRRKKK